MSDDERGTGRKNYAKRVCVVRARADKRNFTWFCFLTRVKVWEEKADGESLYYITLGKGKNSGSKGDTSSV